MNLNPLSGIAVVTQDNGADGLLTLEGGIADMLVSLRLKRQPGAWPHFLALTYQT